MKNKFPLNCPDTYLPDFKKCMLEKAPKELAITGRVLSWLKDPYEDLLPVSCTVFHVEDSMEGPNGIDASFAFLSNGLRKGAGVAIDLSALRPAGDDNGRGLTASGPCTFARIYSVYNQVLRRGGRFKNGAVTLYLDATHPDLGEFLKDDPELRWAKKAIYIGFEYFEHPLRNEIAEAVDAGRVWLAKRNYDGEGNRLYSNVCLEILLKHRGTCLISNVNYAMIRNICDIPDVMEASMNWLCTLHPRTRVHAGGFYLSPKEDKQVGLGVIGFASFLAQQNITYQEYLIALEYYYGITSFREEPVRAIDDLVNKYFVSGLTFKELPEEIKQIVDKKALYLVHCRVLGYHRAAKVAREAGMERAFTVAPTANSFTNHKDYSGEYSVTPEISPPVGKEVERISETLGVKTYQFHPRVQTAAEVGWETHKKVVEFEMLMMKSTNLAHSISFNVWDTQKVTPEWIDQFLEESDLETTYYRLSVNQQTNVKNRQLSEEEINSLSYLPGEEEMTGGSLDELFNTIFDEVGVIEDATPTCSLDGYCEACGGD